MLTAKVGQKGTVFIVQLVGMVDDEADFEKAIGPLPEKRVELYVNCAKITRINSVGVKAWIKYFQKVSKEVARVVFLECSPPIVQQANSVFNFLCGGIVASVQISYACPQCGHIFLQNRTTAEIRKVFFEIPDQACPKCGAMAQFDDLPKLYFKFLMKT